MRFIFIISTLLLVHRAQAQNNWFAFQPTDYYKEKTLDMSGWLDKPAGKHGFLQIKNKDFVFEDNTSIKFWGVNIASNEPFSNEKKVKEYINLMSKYGINAVRFHKFTWDATDGIHSTQLTESKWQNFDRFSDALQQAGIYYSWSHIYGHKIRTADSARVVAYNEIKNTRFPWAHLNGTTASLVNFAEDLQALNIELTVNMLNHINPFTGKKYADDAALAFIELQNEDNIFWAAIEETLKQTPTYRKLLCQKFSRWLKVKYKTTGALRAAWKNEGIKKNESLEQENIYPNPNHGLFSYEYEKALKADGVVPVHIADRATFLYEEQMHLYNRFVKAIRETGYKGVIVGSCWQAGSGITHFYNLYSDYQTGAIDRHNYFGGGTGHQLKPGKFDNASMLSKPGSGLLSTGFQMVNDRPFLISEWMSLIPTEWVAESAPIVAAYGLGLQGWDASFSFAMDFTHFTNTIQSGHGVYNVTSPTQLALYPALATMIYRKDVKEGDPTVNRNINIADLKKGSLTLNEKTSQQYDIKQFESDIPLEALAVGPVTISFNEKGKDFYEDPSPWWNKKNKTITANTHQLKWDYNGKGYFTINTEGTKAVVGFAPDKEILLGDVSIQTSNKFAVIFVTSLEKDKTITSSNKILITTLARAKNVGMKFNKDTTALLEVGEPAILLEPVDVEISINRKGNPIITALDHAGNKTEHHPLFEKNKLTLRGTITKAIYYLIEY